MNISEKTIRETTTHRLTTDELKTIFANATPLFERKAELFTAAKNDDPYEIDRVWNNWKMSVGNEDESSLLNRLELAGLQKEDIFPLLGKVKATVSLPKEDWWDHFKKIADDYWEHNTSQNTTENCNYLIVDDPYPFEEIWIPIVNLSTEILRQKSSESFQYLSEKALIKLQRALLRKLFILGSEVLLLEFNIFKNSRSSGLQRLVSSQSESIDDIYQEFIHFHLQNGMKRIFLEYPVLAKLTAVISNYWVLTTTEFLNRWHQDHNGFTKYFFQKQTINTAEIVDIECSLSDSHNQGRTVMIATLQNENKIVYKPRSLFSEKLWNDLLHWLNDKGNLSLKILEVWDKANYGWMEFARYGTLNSEKECKSYYNNCGNLLGLSYVMGSSDFHYENLIVSDSKPVIIDLETITHHGRKDGIMHEGTLDQLLNHAFGESVLRTGMLPSWIPGSEGNSVDISAFGAVDSQSTRVKMPDWIGINTNFMKRVLEFKSTEPGKNAPKLKDKVIAPGPYRKDITDGFKTVYSLMQNNKDILLLNDSLVRCLANQNIRFIFRPTYKYYMLMHRCLDPICMRNGAARSVILDSLADDLIPSDQNNAYEILAQEHTALDREDCPYFSGPANGLVINGGSGNVSGIIEHSAYARILERLDFLSKEDLEKQLNYCEASFDSRNHYSQHQEAAPSQGERIVIAEVKNRQEKNIEDRLLEAALKTGDDLIHSIIQYEKKGCSWMTLRFLPEIKKLQLLGVGPNLFEGRVGIALFLSGLSVVSKEQKYADYARETLWGVRQDLLIDGGKSAAEGIGLHGLTGLAGIAYGFAHIATLLADDSLKQEALELVNTFNPKAEESTDHLDFLAGLAGSIACLISISKITRSKIPLQKATAYGERLLETQINYENQGAGWPTFEDKMITGFAHGQAGIAYALHELGCQTGNTKFIEAAAKAVKLENSTFSKIENNWPDLRWNKLTDEDLTYADGWCHGAPGIALGRLGMMQSGKVSYERDIDAALAILKNSNTQRVDHLCCGNAGRLLILNEIMTHTKDDALQEEITQQLTFMLDRHQKVGDFKYWWKPYTYVPLPSFFQGSSGIGYSFLRMLAPEIIPNILLGK